MDVIELVSVVCVLVFLYTKRVNNSALWSATVTPLASIIGSGFLVSGPLLVGIFFGSALSAMMLVVLASYLIGEVIRFNIRYTEPYFDSNSPLFNHRIHQKLTRIEGFSDLSLACAYIISVGFYIRLLSAFGLKLFDIENAIAANMLATVLLMVIASIGWYKNLRGLVSIEKHAVNAKLAIIAGLLVVLGISFYSESSIEASVLPQISTTDLWRFDNLCYLAGVLMIVQGFETSRYLGSHYSVETRIVSMRVAQLLAGMIYCFFIYWSTHLFAQFNGHTSETEIIAVVGKLSLLLPYLLIVAAIFSQFSAAIADTLGGGGLLSQLSMGRVNEKTGYIIICSVAILLIWSTNIFSLITIASKAFAIYYFFQCVVAILIGITEVGRTNKMAIGRIGLPIVISLLMLFVIVFAKPIAA